ncbi:MAG: oligosaccharide flippase family protein [Pseudomonadota bacterium]
MRWDRHSIWSVLRASGATSGSTALSILFHFVGIMLIARLVEKEVFGAYILILAVVQGVKVFAGFGLDLTLTHHLAGEWQPSRAALFMRVLWLRLLGLMLVSVSLLAVAEWLSLLDVRLRDHLGYLLAIAFVGSGRELLLAALQGMLEFRHYAYSMVLPAALRLICVTLLFAVGLGDLVALLRVELAVLVASLIFMLCMPPIRQMLDHSRTNRDLTLRLLYFSGPLYLNSIIYFLGNRLNAFLLAGMSNSVQLANYGAAWQIPDGCSRVYNAFMAAYFPFASRTFTSDDPQDVTRLAEVTLATTALANMLLFLFASFFGAEILIILFGAQYASASLTFALLIAVYGLQSLVSVMGFTLVAAGHPGVTARINIAGTILLLAGGLSAIPKFGAAGAALALVISTIFVLMLNWRALRARNLDVASSTFLIPLALAVVAVILGRGLLTDSTMLQALVLLVYVVSCGVAVPELRASGRFLLREARVLFSLPRRGS